MAKSLHFLFSQRMGSSWVHFWLFYLWSPWLMGFSTNWETAWEERVSGMLLWFPPTFAGMVTVHSSFTVRMYCLLMEEMQCCCLDFQQWNSNLNMGRLSLAPLSHPGMSNSTFLSRYLLLESWWIQTSCAQADFTAHISRKGGLGHLTETRYLTWGDWINQKDQFKIISNSIKRGSVYM